MMLTATLEKQLALTLMKIKIPSKEILAMKHQEEQDLKRDPACERPQDWAEWERFVDSTEDKTDEYYYFHPRYKDDLVL